MQIQFRCCSLYVIVHCGAIKIIQITRILLWFLCLCDRSLTMPQNWLINNQESDIPEAKGIQEIMMLMHVSPVGLCFNILKKPGPLAPLTWNLSTGLQSTLKVTRLSICQTRERNLTTWNTTVNGADSCASCQFVFKRPHTHWKKDLFKSVLIWNLSPGFCTYVGYISSALLISYVQSGQDIL